MNNPTPYYLSEVRRYLQALAQSHIHLFDVLVRLTCGPLLARRDASLKSSLRVQSLELSTLFGSKMPDVAKTSKEDLTRRSLQNATVSHSFPRKQMRKAGSKSEELKLVVNTSNNGQHQVVSKHSIPPKSSQGSSSSQKNLSAKYLKNY